MYGYELLPVAHLNPVFICDYEWESPRDRRPVRVDHSTGEIGHLVLRFADTGERYDPAKAYCPVEWDRRSDYGERLSN